MHSWSAGRRSAILTCIDEEAWIESFGVADGLARLALVRREGIVREASLGDGFVTSVSRAPRGVMLATLTDMTGHSRLMRSVDEGATWQPARGPRDVVGVTHHSDQEIFAWTEKEVFATKDGGGTWHPVFVAEGAIRRGNASGCPVVAGSALLVPEQVGHDVRIHRVQMDGTSRSVAAFPGGTITGAGVVAPGAVLMSVALGRETLVVEIDTREGRVSPVSRLEGEGHLQANGGAVLLRLLGNGPAPRSALSDWPSRLLLSRDDGATWTEAPDDGSADSICAAGEGYWAVSDLARHVFYRRYKR